MIHNSGYQASDASTYHEDFESVIPKDDSANRMTLDKILGNSFRMIDLSTMKDLSNELFPAKPLPTLTLARVSTRKLQLPKVRPVLHRKEDNRDHLEVSQERTLKLSESLAPRRVASQIENFLSVKKHSQRSLIADRSERGLQDLSYKTPGGQEGVLFKLKKPKKEENLSYSPDLIKVKKRYFEYRRNGAESHLEVMSSVNVRAVECPRKSFS
jgi:hypothetical protein